MRWDGAIHILVRMCIAPSHRISLVLVPISPIAKTGSHSIRWKLAYQAVVVNLLMPLGCQKRWWELCHIYQWPHPINKRSLIDQTRRNPNWRVDTSRPDSLPGEDYLIHIGNVTPQTKLHKFKLVCTQSLLTKLFGFIKGFFSFRPFVALRNRLFVDRL